MRELGQEPYPHMDSGDHCDDAEQFEVLLMEQEPEVFRKTTNKKQKRISMMSAMLDAEEFNRLRRLRGESRGPVQRKPHVGKTWVKQLFAGQMGMSILAVFTGPIGHFVLVMGCYDQARSTTASSRSTG